MKATPPSIENVNRYLRSIRNDAKHDYANRYATYLRAFLPGGHPEFATEPECPSNLSYLAAQAVRMTLREMVGVSP